MDINANSFDWSTGKVQAWRFCRSLRRYEKNIKFADVQLPSALLKLLCIFIRTYCRTEKEEKSNGSTSSFRQSSWLATHSTNCVDCWLLRAFKFFCTVIRSSYALYQLRLLLPFACFHAVGFAFLEYCEKARLGDFADHYDVTRRTSNLPTSSFRRLC